MDADLAAVLFTLAIVIGLVGVAASSVSPTVRELVHRHAVRLGAAVASSATAGSLYFSEVAGFVPCDLCWYQRIAMYPLALLFVMGVIRGDREILRYGRVLAGLGFLVSGYHVWIQWFPEQSNFCEISNPCTAEWVEAFGFVTIPLMAGLSFVLVVATATIGLRQDSASSS